MVTKKYVDSLPDPTTKRAAKEARTAPKLKRRGKITCHHCGRGWEDLENGFPVRMARAGWEVGEIGQRLFNFCPVCLAWVGKS